MLEEAGVKPTQFDSQSLGTVGRGNHFAELQVNIFLHWTATGRFVGDQKTAHVQILTPYEISSNGFMCSCQKLVNNICLCCCHETIATMGTICNTRGVRAFRTWFGLDKLSLRTMILEILSLYKHLQRLYILRNFINCLRCEKNFLGCLDGDPCYKKIAGNSSENHIWKCKLSLIQTQIVSVDSSQWPLSKHVSTLCSNQSSIH